MVRQSTWALAALTLIAGGPARAAAGAQFEACDGYGSPTSSGDGMIKPAMGLFGIFVPTGSAGNTRRAAVTLGSSGIAACDEALADPRLLDKFWERRVSLLRARAIHELAADAISTALTDLDAAEKAAVNPQDAYYRRSLALGIDLVRAYALRRQGQAEAARVLVSRVLAARPFDRHTVLAAMAILGDDGTTTDAGPVLQLFARLAPTAIDDIFLHAMEQGDFAAAIKIHPHLVAPIKVLDIGQPRDQTWQQEIANAAIALIYPADRRARLAYALAAAGQATAAREAYAAAIAQLDTGTPQPLPAPAPGTREKRADQEERGRREAMIAAAKRIRPSIEHWGRLVEARLALAEGKPPPEPSTVAPLPPGGVAIDLLEAVRRARPGLNGLDAVIAHAKAMPARETPSHANELRMLFDSLPHTEVQKLVAPYKKAKSELMGYLWGGVSGFRISEQPADGTVTVQFTGEQSSSSTVEEMALLRAADLMREQGKEGFVIRSRADYERTNVTTYFGTPLRSDPNGYQTILVIEPVARQADASRYTGAPWRIIRAQAVIDQLGPTYFAPASPSTESPNHARLTGAVTPAG